uniref:Uncharacterized protein n=1 Tax=viral metagenome TaxID=1070528 RepID=A0A6M3IDP6_9ZZZZ
MTVGELIETLRNFPADMPVLVNGYGGGFDEPDAPLIKRVVRDTCAGYYEAAYTSCFDPDESVDSFDALCIRR